MVYVPTCLPTWVYIASRPRALIYLVPISPIFGLAILVWLIPKPSYTTLDPIPVTTRIHRQFLDQEQSISYPGQMKFLGFRLASSPYFSTRDAWSSASNYQYELTIDNT